MHTDRVGKYRIIAKLGQGGMATVFLSVVPGPVGFNKLLVVKLLKEDLAQDGDFLAMFLNEARLAARLNHANVVQTYEVGVEGPHHFLAMEYLDGQPLHAVLRKATRATMPLDIHVRILADALAGLHYAHTLRDFDGAPLRVVHRDVSPQNVFVTYDGQAKVVDFGIAKAAGASSNTQSGVFKGKLAYVAPEQASGDPVDASADVFSVGVMLWEAMACERFAHGEGQSAILARRLSGNEPRIRAVVPDADTELADICDRAMAHDRRDRFESAQAFRDALENFLDRFSRRVSSREVGDFMALLFNEEREKIRQIIDDQMKQLMRETGDVLPVPTLDFHQGAADPTPAVTTVDSPQGAQRVAAARREGVRASGVDDSAPGSGSQGTLVAAHISQTPPSKASKGRALLIGLLAVALASVGGVVFILFSSNPPVATPPSATDSERIKLSLSFGPPGTTAKLDGVRLSDSPFIAQLPRDGSVHRIDVEGSGLEPETRMVSYDKDIAITIVLAPRVAAPADPSASAAASTAASSSAAPRDTGKRVPGATPPASKNTAQPLEIDEQDPYKK